MPFGLHGAAANFQRLMDKVLQGAEGYARAYIDDVVVFSQSWEDHLKHLAEVFDRLKDAGLVINPEKTVLCKDEVQYLGYTIGGGIIRPQVDKVAAIQNRLQPATKRQVRSFLGLVGWYRRFIPNFSSIAAPLSDLLKNQAPRNIKWTETCEHAFNTLKKVFCENVLLHCPDFSKPFILQVDASGEGLGAALMQGEGEERRPILFISRKLFDREKKYAVLEKEGLAIKWAIDSLKYYLLSTEFVVESDHRALQWIQRMRHSNARVARWYLSLQPYKFQVRYVSGKKNLVADYLSRLCDL
ncbi:POL3 protein, partial [Polypterus senegalus]